MVEFPSGQKWVKFPEINLQNYVLGEHQVTTHTMGHVHGSSNQSYPNGTLDLPMMSRGYGTLVDQTTPLDHAFLSIQNN